MLSKVKNVKREGVKYSRGAAAIEFALLFMFLFTFFYATVTYALVFLLQASFNHAASEGARAAISVDPQAFSSDADYIDQGVTPTIRTTVGNALNWLPSKARLAVLGANNGNVDVTVVDKLLTVRVRYSNYASNPLIPLISIPGIGPIFLGPNDLQGRAVLRLV